jgi:hypothetical protein
MKLLEGKGGVKLESDCSNCPSLLPPESPFVFWSIPRLAYLGLARRASCVGLGVGAWMIRPYHLEYL